MRSLCNHMIETIYPKCLCLLGRSVGDALLTICENTTTPEAFEETIRSHNSEIGLPDYIAELAQLEWNLYEVKTAKETIPCDTASFEINPSLRIIPLSWKLCSFVKGKENRDSFVPGRGEEWALIWKDPESGNALIEAASNEDLIALKIIADELPLEEATGASHLSVDVLYAGLWRAAEKGLLIAPQSRIQRDTSLFPMGEETPRDYVEVNTFTIQWHITNACDLHCKHCYDRTKRSPLTLEGGYRILDDLGGFCRDRYVRGHVCFTGGNPFMSPHFFKLYQAAVDHGFSISILGNPVSREQMKRLLEIRRPEYFQVSLEGLEEHNDSIRGKGNFNRVIAFLDVPHEFDVSSAVMLTLTKDNIDQVLPLAELLRAKTDYFTFNRLSPVGEGAHLHLPSKYEYFNFLEKYIEAAENNPIIGFKDNLINIVLHRMKEGLHEGCTGFGCGAAFNFLAVLPDGEVHACRKFPSLLGRVPEQGITDIYNSEMAKRYRGGARECDLCAIRYVCGGCLACASGLERDIFTDRDPYCDMNS